ncbi:sensor histidine kinase [Paenibacillus sp. HWE-109]|uniref:sensor histidine kinase n=1 Tax=Paenibacillus sp. HWE-109 TaxID=1306526 RepID=UPI001EDCF09D|nr:sensor histidine kinase [Paenibacillus sp. HWE-109]UKS30851.1 sensor histidine kinase [Paenibacillus sp. HWE-109]
MNLVHYIKDKRFFFLFYIIMMLFISLIMLASVKWQDAINNIVYANVGSFIFATIYLLVGYYYRKSFYNELHDLVGIRQEEWLVAAMPEPQNTEQTLYLKLLEHLYEEQSRGTQQLHSEIRDHQDFILSWIHEVKVPIAASRLMMENRASKTADQLVDKLEDELSKIDNYVEQALYYSRIDSFSRDYFITDVPLQSIVKDSVKKFAKLFITKKIRPNIEALTHAVNTDSKWLSYITNQIVANALTYTNTGGTISFQSEELEYEKRLLIQDTGVGISSADLGRVFDKGFTGSIGRTHHKSTGMGLYLAKQMALKLGHHLTITSREGHGTTVTIHFPKVRNYDDLR